MISRAVLRQIHGSPAIARLLVEGGFFDVHEKGWSVVGYENHQPSRVTTEAVRRARSEAGRKGMEARWGDAKQ